MPVHAPRLTHDSIGIRPRINELLALALVSVLLSGGLLAPSEAHAVVSSADRVDGQQPSKLGVPKPALPDVGMRAGILATSDGRALWDRHPKSRRAIASITKIMTAVVAMEHAEPDEIVTVGRESLRVGESTSFLRLGQKLKLSELLEALLIKSGNDAAVATAVHVAGSEEQFVKLMNRKATELGLTGTHFANAHGLDAPGHYSTARDLAVLSRYAMSKPEFRRIVKKKRARVGSGRGSIKIENTNLLLGNYAGANGIKTGFTNDAGHSVVASARRGDIELVAVVLGTGSDVKRIREARALLDFGFAHFRPQRLASAGTVIGEAPVADYLDVTVPAAIATDTVVSVLDFAGPITRTVSVAAVEAPVSAGDRVGVATFTQHGKVIATVALHATRGVRKPNLFQRIGILFARAWRGLVGAT
jgi:serine-type D-Ala-D-Ala carboxypeptidase (penicillin-binding protein 5/6)